MSLLLTIVMCVFLVLVLIHSIFIVFTFTLSVAHGKPEGPSAFERLWVMVREWWFSLGVLLAWPLGWLPSRSLRKRGPGPVIVLLHGYVTNRSSMFGLYWRLRRAGFGNVCTLNIGFLRGYGRIEAAGAYIADSLVHVQSVFPGSRFVCIAHSMGGLVARSAAMQNASLQSMDIITLGTPHQGTALAELGFGGANTDMRSGSNFLACLHAYDVANGRQFMSIESDTDNIVFPFGAAAAPGRHYSVSLLGHQQLLFDGTVFKRIQQTLEQY